MNIKWPVNCKNEWTKNDLDPMGLPVSASPSARSVSLSASVKTSCKSSETNWPWSPGSCRSLGQILDGIFWTFIYKNILCAMSALNHCNLLNVIVHTLQTLNSSVECQFWLIDMWYYISWQCQFWAITSTFWQGH